MVLRDAPKEIQNLARLTLTDSLSTPVGRRTESDFIAFGGRNEGRDRLRLVAVCAQIPKVIESVEQVRM